MSSGSTSRALAAVCFLIVSALVWLALASPPTRLAYINAKVLTMDSSNSVQQAVLIHDGHIAAVGSTQEISKLFDKSTHVTDLKGKVLLPGFIDLSGKALHSALKPALSPDSLVPLFSEWRRASKRAAEQGVTSFLTSSLDQTSQPWLHRASRLGIVRQRLLNLDLPAHSDLNLLAQRLRAAGEEATPLQIIWALANQSSEHTQALPVVSALARFTRDAAQELAISSQLGSIEPGKRADLLVLQDDPLLNPVAIRDMQPLLTLVGGQKIYNR